MALGTRTKFQLEIPMMNMISGIVYFRESATWNTPGGNTCYATHKGPFLAQFP